MWDSIVTVGGWVLVVVLFLFCAHWTDLERKHLSKDDSRYRE